MIPMLILVTMSILFLLCVLGAGFGVSFGLECVVGVCDVVVGVGFGVNFDVGDHGTDGWWFWCWCRC